MRIKQYDTICAPVTVRGESAVALIRVSGPDAVNTVSGIFSNGKKLKTAPGGAAMYGRIRDGDGRPVDEAVVTLFRDPASFTGEDVVEIATHGSPLVVDTVMELLHGAGARLAEPGEFTRRAFVNGKMTLTEAEAVADIIEAKNRRVLDFAEKNLRGRLDEKLNAYTEEITVIMAELNLSIDFDEEGLEETHWETITRSMEKMMLDMERDIDASRNVIREKDGISLLIMGEPNTGKSTLMNALLGKERVLVSETAGTTRDYVSETMVIHGHRVHISDTAGLRQKTDDHIEKMGIEIAYRLMEKSDLIVYLSDARKETAALPSAVENSGKPLIHCLNKCDLIDTKHAAGGSFYISASTGHGLDRLREIIAEEADRLTDSGENKVVMLNRRQMEHLIMAKNAMGRALAAARETTLEEVVSDLLRESAKELEMIGGRKIVETVLDKIFGRFCLGK